MKYIVPHKRPRAFSETSRPECPDDDNDDSNGSHQGAQSPSSSGSASSLDSSSDQQFDEAPELYRSSGIVPFAVDPVTQTIYVLLARSSFPAGRGKWSDFGGGVSSEDHRDDRRTAAREFTEESLCALRGIGGDRQHVTFRNYMDHVWNTLCTHRFSFALDQVVHFPKSPEQRSIRRIVYTMRVPWQPDVNERFQSMRQTLQHARDGTAGTGEIRRDMQSHPAFRSADGRIGPEWFEKSVVRWFSLDFLVQCLSNGNSFRGVHLRYSFVEALRVIVTKLSHLRNPETV